MTLELRKGEVTPLGVDLRDWRRRAPAVSQPVLVFGLGVIVSLALVGLVGLSATAGTTLFQPDEDWTQNGSASTSGHESLKVLSGVVEQRRAAVAAYAAEVADYSVTVSRRPSAPGTDALGLDSSEMRLRQDALTSLTLDCIHAVDQYNLGAQTVAATEIRSAGLPERFEWGVDCASAR